MDGWMDRTIYLREKKKQRLSVRRTGGKILAWGYLYRWIEFFYWSGVTWVMLPVATDDGKKFSLVHGEDT